MSNNKTAYRAHTCFVKRTQNIFRHQKERALQAGIQLDYDIHGLRAHVRGTIGQPCEYCQEEITPKNFSVDHIRPVSRGGAWSAANLWVCCTRCNQVKGNMTGAEFHHLLEALREIDPVARKSVLARLRAGGKIIRS